MRILCYFSLSWLVKIVNYYYLTVKPFLCRAVPIKRLHDFSAPPFGHRFDWKSIYIVVQVEARLMKKYRRRTFNMHCIDDNDAFSNRSWIDENNALIYIVVQVEALFDLCFDEIEIGLMITLRFPLV